MSVTTTISYSYLPEHMQVGARRYVEHGVRPGGFLRAVLCDDLIDAVMHADSGNLAAIRNWCLWLLNDAPDACHGSDAAVRAWIAHGGLSGKLPE